VHEKENGETNPCPHLGDGRTTKANDGVPMGNAVNPSSCGRPQSEGNDDLVLICETRQTILTTNQDENENELDTSLPSTNVSGVFSRHRHNVAQQADVATDAMSAPSAVTKIYTANVEILSKKNEDVVLDIFQKISDVGEKSSSNVLENSKHKTDKETVLPKHKNTTSSALTSFHSLLFRIVCCLLFMVTRSATGQTTLLCDSFACLNGKINKGYSVQCSGACDDATCCKKLTCNTFFCSSELKYNKGFLNECLDSGCDSSTCCGLVANLGKCSSWTGKDEDCSNGVKLAVVKKCYPTVHEGSAIADCDKENCCSSTVWSADGNTEIYGSCPVRMGACEGKTEGTCCKCPTGKYSDTANSKLNSDSAQPCKECPAGYYQNNKNSAVCKSTKIRNVPT
jgi:hypothetical protein